MQKKFLPQEKLLIKMRIVKQYVLLIEFQSW